MANFRNISSLQEFFKSPKHSNLSVDDKQNAKIWRNNYFDVYLSAKTFVDTINTRNMDCGLYFTRIVGQFSDDNCNKSFNINLNSVHAFDHSNAFKIWLIQFIHMVPIGLLTARYVVPMHSRYCITQHSDCSVKNRDTNGCVWHYNRYLSENLVLNINSFYVYTL